MPSAPRRRAPRRARKARATRPRRSKRSRVTNVPERASCSVSRTIAGGMNANAIYSFENLRITDFPRAVIVAAGYQEYCIKAVKVTWRPAFDSFLFTNTVPNPTPAQKAYLYTMVNKSGSIPDNVTLESLKQMGVRPRVLDERAISVTWSPAVFVDVAVAGAAFPGKPLKSPWLSTNANFAPGTPWIISAVPHTGLLAYIEQGGATLGTAVEIELQFMFRKPLISAVAGPSAVRPVYAEINDSPDGVVGGADEY